MKLQLTKPLVFFDLEATGTNIGTDRIVEISLLKIFPNGSKESKTWLVNPQVAIPKQVSDIHGITNEKVANEPTFKQLASEIHALLEGADLAGFNSNKFDIPLLAEEFTRAGISFDMEKKLSIDVQTIFHKKEQRTLSAGYQFYCGKQLENPHSAKDDTRATYEILLAQLERYKDLGGDVKSLSDFSTQRKRVDLAGFIVYNDEGKEIFTFGKYKNCSVSEVLEKNPGYYSWMQNADFPLYTKKKLTQIRLKTLHSK